MALSLTTIPYNNSNILYQQASDWSVVSVPNDGISISVQRSTVANSSITFKFKGTALQVNIWFDLDAANYTAYMGGDTITRPHGLEVLSSTGVQGDLSWRNLTADKEYTLRIVKTPDDPSWTPTTPGKSSHLSFDSFLLNGTVLSPPAPDQTASDPTSTPGASTPKSTPVGAIVGGIIGGLALLGLIAAWIWFRRRRRPAFPRHEPFVDPNASVGDFMRSKGLHESDLGSSSTLNLVPLGRLAGGVDASPDARRKEPERRERRDRRDLREKQPLPGVSSTNTSNTDVNGHNTLLPLPNHRFLRVTTSQHSSDTAVSSPPFSVLTTSNTAGSSTGTSSDYPPTDVTQSQPTQSSYSGSVLLSTIAESEEPLRPSGRSASVPISPEAPKTPRSANREQGFDFPPQPTTNQRLSIAKPPISPNSRTDNSPATPQMSDTLMTASGPESSSGPITPPIMRLGLHNPETTATSTGRGGRRPTRAQAQPGMDENAANSLLNEVAILRAQVRNLEEMRRQYEGDEDELPPEYDDDDEDPQDVPGGAHRRGDSENSARTRQNSP